MRLCRRPILSAISLSIVCAFLGAIPIAAHQRAAPSGPTIQVYSRETLVDVTVTDAKGQPIHGLTRSDFTVEEDGRPQTIRSFREFSKDAAMPAPLRLPPNVYTNLQSAAGPLTVLLFDDINDGDGIEARWEAAKFIKGMAPGTQVALIALADRLTILQGPTSDPALLLKVVNNPVKPYFVQAVACTKQVALDWATLDQLHQLASYLSGIRGKKNVIWIGNSIANMIFPPPVGCQDWRLPLQQTYDLLGDAQITVYPLDPNGVVPMGLRQLAMQAVAESTGGVAYYENNDLKSIMAKVADLGASYYSISYVPPSLAYDGKFHTIGIKVDRPGIHLVYRKGYSAEDPTQLAHPPETLFGSKTPATKPAGLAPDGPEPDPLAVALSPIAPPATQILFEVRVEPTSQPPSPTDPAVIGQLDPKLKKLPLSRYDILYTLPPSQIAFADGGGGTYSGSLEFNIAAYDADGKLVSIRSQTMTLPLTNEEYWQFIQTPFQFLEQLDLPPGQLSLRVGIFDGVSNKVGTLAVPVDVDKAAPAKSEASSPRAKDGN